MPEGTLRTIDSLDARLRKHRTKLAPVTPVAVIS